MDSTDQEVIIVGAGLAGLRCAARLLELGRSVTVLESADRVGGRVRTDQIDGFLCDHGFQVLNPAYPAVKRWIDIEALELQHFGSGILIRREAGLAVLADPIRSAKTARDALMAGGLTKKGAASGLLKPREVAALTRWLAPALASPRRTLADADESLGASLDRAGVTGALRHEVLHPFLAGVSVDSHEETSAILSKLLIRMFALGRPGLPRRGMRALPVQIADSVRQGGGIIKVGRAVDAVRRVDRGVSVETAGETLTASAVVVAADPVTGSHLAEVSAPTMKGLVTWWFASEQAPHDLPLLVVDGRRDATSIPLRESPGPVWNAAVISNAAPSYAPEGQHLIAATTLLDRPDGEAPEGEVRKHLGELYGCDTSEWQVVVRHHIPNALPAYPPLTRPTSAVDLGGGLFVAGDHRDTPSIQGALVSGNRTAEAVDSALGG